MSSVLRSGIDYYDVHVGFWTNWAHGRVKGATFTLTRRDAGLLISFIAIFVTTVGRSFWRIACFLLHRYFSSTYANDGLYHQRQVILRNSETAEAAIWQFFCIGAAWRKGRAQRVYARLAFVIIVGTILVSSFILAGIFSSRITTDAANEVLLTGKRCAAVQTPDDKNASIIDHVNAFYAMRAQAYLNYAQQCYTDDRNSEDCSQYVRARLPMNISRNASCPFGDNICKSTNSNLLIDTGFLNSNSHLGINMPPKEQFLVRIVNHCAPLKSDGYARETDEGGNSSTTFMRYYYGSSVENNFTYEAPLVPSEYRMNQDGSFRIMSGLHERPEYSLGLIQRYGGVPNFSNIPLQMKPIPELKKPDADLALYFLSAPQLLYPEPIDDPWFSAHRPGPQAVVSNGGPDHNSFRATYAQDEPASCLGCTTQFQLCNPNLPEKTRCQELGGYGWNLVKTSYSYLWNEEASVNRMEWVAQIIAARIQPPEDSVSSGGSAVLLARQGQRFAAARRLPSNQWQEEMIHLMQAYLASLQGLLVESAAGVKKGIIDDAQRPPETAEARRVCESQKIMSRRFSSFSVLGLSLILCIGLLIIALDYTLEALLETLNKKHRNAYARLEWQSNSLLQLQRLAHEGAGINTWENAHHNVPVTAAGHTLAVLDIKDRQHPRLKETATLRPLSTSTTPMEQSRTDSVPEASSDEKGSLRINLE